MYMSIVESGKGFNDISTESNYVHICSVCAHTHVAAYGDQKAFLSCLLLLLRFLFRFFCLNWNIVRTVFHFLFLPSPTSISQPLPGPPSSPLTLMILSYFLRQSPFDEHILNIWGGQCTSEIILYLPPTNAGVTGRSCNQSFEMWVLELNSCLQAWVLYRVFCSQFCQCETFQNVNRASSCQSHGEENSIS